MGDTDDPRGVQEAAVRAAFLGAYGADRRAGRSRSLARYLRRFPGFERLIAREHRALLEPREHGPGEAALPPGTRLGSYRVLRQLGRGGQGRVLLCHDEQLGRRVALKVLNGWGQATDGALRRFLREAEILSRLEHPGICTVYGAGFEGGLPYIAMRYVRGRSLAQALEAARGVGASPPVRPPGTPPLPPASPAELDRVLTLFEAIAAAVHAAHRAGVVHRDLKPANLLVTPPGEPVVLDFGLARIEGAEGASLTRTGEVFGTPRYMAPEQLLGGPVDPRADVYALGVTLYECLTLRPPFDGPTPQALQQAVLDGVPPDPRALNPEIGEDLRAVLAQALDRDPGRRHASALALAEDLRRVRAGEPVLARPPGPWLRARRWARRRPARALTALGLLLAVAGSAALALQRASSEREITRLAREASAGRREARELNALVDRNVTDTLVAIDDAVHQLAGPREGSTDGSVQGLRGLLSICRALASERGNEVAARTQRAWAQLREGKIHEALGEYDAAQGVYRRAGELFAELALAHPEEPEYRRGRAVARSNAGLLCRRAGQNAEAEAHFREALALIAANPTGDLVCRDRARYAHYLAQALLGRGAQLEALDQLLRAVRSLEERLAAGGRAEMLLYVLIQCRGELAELLFQLGEGAAAEAQDRASLREVDRFVASWGEDQQVELLRADCYDRLAERAGQALSLIHI